MEQTDRPKKDDKDREIHAKTMQREQIEEGNKKGKEKKSRLEMMHVCYTQKFLGDMEKKNMLSLRFVSFFILAHLYVSYLIVLREQVSPGDVRVYVMDLRIHWRVHLHPI